MSLKEDECVMTEEALDAVMEIYKNTSGIRDLEQAAEHLAANALYQIEVNNLKKRGYELVTVSELYSLKGKKLKNGVMYFSPNRD